MSSPICYVEGNWEISFAGDRSKSAVCTLIQIGTAFTGFFHGPRGDLLIEGALYNEGNIAFTVESILGSFKFFGMLDGESMSGIVDFPRGKCRENWTAIDSLKNRGIENIASDNFIRLRSVYKSLIIESSLIYQSPLIGWFFPDESYRMAILYGLIREIELWEKIELILPT